jgi:plastocyanin
LLGTVGPGFDITLKNSSGTPLIRLHHGTYTLVVRDRSGIHDFHLIGPGVNRVITSVGFVGAKTVRVTLRPGRYRYICDPHAFVMHGSFRVT